MPIQRRKSQQGASLVELLLFMITLVLIATMAVATMSSASDKRAALQASVQKEQLKAQTEAMQFELDPSQTINQRQPTTQLVDPSEAHALPDNAIDQRILDGASSVQLAGFYQNVAQLYVLGEASAYAANQAIAVAQRDPAVLAMAMAPQKLQIPSVEAMPQPQAVVKHRLDSVTAALPAKDSQPNESWGRDLALVALGVLGGIAVFQYRSKPRGATAGKTKVKSGLVQELRRRVAKAQLQSQDSLAFHRTIDQAEELLRNLSGLDNSFYLAAQQSIEDLLNKRFCDLLTKYQALPRRFISTGVIQSGGSPRQGLLGELEFINRSVAGLNRAAVDKDIAALVELRKDVNARLKTPLLPL